MHLITAPPSVDPNDPIADISIETDSPSGFAPAEEPAPVRGDGPTHYEIAAEAYTRYLERGAKDGHALEDWLEAERVVRERYAHSSPTG